MQGFSCKCEERQKPVLERNWKILDYKCNHSAFNGYKHTPSAYSGVSCESCGAYGRTKAAFVDEIYLKHLKEEKDNGKRRESNTAKS